MPFVCFYEYKQRVISWCSSANSFLHWILQDFQGEKKNTELGSDIMGVEKGGVFVVVSASSWSHKCAHPEDLWNTRERSATAPRNAVALSKQCQHIVWKERFSKGELSSCSGLLVLSLKLPFCRWQLPVMQQVVGMLTAEQLLWAQCHTAVTTVRRCTERLSLSRVICSLNWQKDNGDGMARSHISYTIQNLPSNVKEVTESNALSKNQSFTLINNNNKG